jgi:hypothetical protein
MLATTESESARTKAEGGGQEKLAVMRRPAREADTDNAWLTGLPLCLREAVALRTRTVLKSVRLVSCATVCLFALCAILALRNVKIPTVTSADVEPHISLTPVPSMDGCCVGSVAAARSGELISQDQRALDAIGDTAKNSLCLLGNKGSWSCRRVCGH